MDKKDQTNLNKLWNILPNEVKVWAVLLISLIAGLSQI